MRRQIRWTFLMLGLLLCTTVAKAQGQEFKVKQQPVYEEMSIPIPDVMTINAEELTIEFLNDSAVTLAPAVLQLDKAKSTDRVKVFKGKYIDGTNMTYSLKQKNEHKVVGTYDFGLERLNFKLGKEFKCTVHSPPHSGNIKELKKLKEEFQCEFK